MPHSSINDALEDGLKQSAASDRAEVEADDDAEDLLTDKDWRRMFKSALTASASYQQNKLRSAWSRNYRAFANKHMSGSKYDSYRYRHRSKLFKPKTRMAVRKNDATAASAMFSTEDVVSITPERSSDRVQVMTSRFVHEALNYRLDRDDPMAGPSWFLTAIGARQDAQISGVCVSKQYWEYEEREVKVFANRPKLDTEGMMVIDPATGDVATEEVIETETETIADRLFIELLPPEHAFIDVTADWRDPIQRGGHFIAGFPMRREDLEEMIEKQAARPRIGGGAWRTDIDLKILDQAGSSNQRQAQVVRKAREEGIDRYESRHADENGEVIWLYECFYRYGGQDWHFWMLGEQILLSDPRPVEESYPEQRGRRPYVRGLGALEAHRVYPSAPVETWQPLQQEMNDITNLRLDALKMGISPITKIRRGRNIDWKQVQNRGPDAMVMVEDENDVTFDRAPTPPQTQQDINNLNVDFDELAGVFSQGSVQTNRQLNETVGGMNLLASSSNSLTEFDLRVWIETWAEPVLRQCVRLIQFYETNETVIAVAGEKAGLLSNIETPSEEQALEKDPQEEADRPEPTITIDQVLGGLEDAALHVRINVGIGAMDSRQKLEKFMGGVKMTMEALPLLVADGIEPNAREIMQEGWGLLGYKDAARFFKRKKQEEQGPPPEVQLEMLKQKGTMAKSQQEGQVKTTIEQLRAGLKKLEMRQRGAEADRKMSLEEREFQHEKRMDELELQMKGMERVLGSISDAIGGGQSGQPA